MKISEYQRSIRAVTALRTIEEMTRITPEDKNKTDNIHRDRFFQIRGAVLSALKGIEKASL